MGNWGCRIAGTMIAKSVAMRLVGGVVRQLNLDVSMHLVGINEVLIVDQWHAYIHRNPSHQ